MPNQKEKFESEELFKKHTRNDRTFGDIIYIFIVNKNKHNIQGQSKHVSNNVPVCHKVCRVNILYWTRM